MKLFSSALIILLMTILGVVAPMKGQLVAQGPVVDGAKIQGSPARAGNQAVSGENGNSIYRLRAGDTIEMKVYQEGELDSTVQLDQSGAAIMPLVGAIPVSGLTPEEAAQRIREEYMKEYLVDPLVSVTISKYGNSFFTVLGQVKNPGYYVFPSNQKMDLLQAIAMAGGYTRIGSPSKITVKRNVKGVERVLSVNAKKMAEKEDSQIFAVERGDIISVGESLF